MLFWRSVCPSIWGWKAVLSRHLRHTNNRATNQDCDVNKEPRSETIEFGIPWCLMIEFRITSARPSAVRVFWTASQWTIFVRRSTMTRIESYLTPRQSLLGRSPVTKSIVKSFHLCEGIGRDRRLLYGVCGADLALIHTSHPFTYFSTSTLRVSQCYFRAISS